jgi:hypothetical protein
VRALGQSAAASNNTRANKNLSAIEIYTMVAPAQGASTNTYTYTQKHEMHHNIDNA